MMFSCSNTAINATLIISILVLVSSIVIKWVAVPMVIESQAYSNLELVEGTTGFDVWIEPPNEIFLKYYFFNVENPDEIKKGAKANLTQVGPYVYKEIRKKQNIVPIGDEELLYGQFISYTFDLEQTLAQGCIGPDPEIDCSSRDNVTIINTVLVGMVDILNSLNIPPIMGVNISGLILDQFNEMVFKDGAQYPDDLFHTFAVDDILWQGFEPGIIQYLFSIINALSEALGIDLNQFLPPNLNNGTLAFFRGKNATDDKSFYKVNRGRNEKHKYCMIEELNGDENLPSSWWTTMAMSPTAQRSGVTGN